MAQLYPSATTTPAPRDRRQPRGPRAATLELLRRYARACHAEPRLPSGLATICLN